MMTRTFLLPNSTDQQIYPDDDLYFSSCLTLLINRSILMMTITFLHALLGWSIDLSWWWPYFSLPNSAGQQIDPDDDQNFSPSLLCWSTDLTCWWSLLFFYTNYTDQQIYPDDDQLLFSRQTLLISRSNLMTIIHFSHALLCWSSDLFCWWPVLFFCLTMLINRSILMMTSYFLMPNSVDQQIYPDDDHYFSFT